MSRPARLLLAAVLSLGLPARPVAGAVFLRRPRSCSAALEALGGVRLEDEAAEVDGARGSLRVYAFDRPAADVLDSVRRELPDGAGSGNLVVVPCGSDGAAQCLAFAFEAGAPGTPRWPWLDLAPPADAELAFSALLGRGRAGFASGVSAAAPEAARLAWSAALAAAGWTPASPAADATSLSLHVRPGETLALAVLPADDGLHGSRFAVLRRRGAAQQFSF